MGCGDIITTEMHCWLAQNVMLDI